jgi:hypothetical protein
MLRAHKNAIHGTRLAKKIAMNPESSSGLLTLLRRRYYTKVTIIEVTLLTQ